MNARLATVRCIDPDKLEWAMNSIRPRCREAIELRADGWTFKAIAKALGGVCVERARQLVMSAQIQLQRKLSSRFYDYVRK